MVVLKFAGGGGVGDRGVDFARAAVGRGELDGVLAGNEMGGDRGSERSGAGEGEGADGGEGLGQRGGADPVGVFARAIGAGEKFGAGAGGERAGDAEGGLGGAADDGFFPDGAGVADDVAEAERVAGRGEVGEEREVGKEAPSSLQAKLSVDGRQRVGERREMKRPLRSRRVLGVVERALPAASGLAVNVVPLTKRTGQLGELACWARTRGSGHVAPSGEVTTRSDPVAAVLTTKMPWPKATPLSGPRVRPVSARANLTDWVRAVGPDTTATHT